jgi:hypothetical protein
MQATSCIAIGQMGFFLGVKTTKIDALFVVRNHCLPTPIGIFHPRKTPNTLQAMLIIVFAVCPILAVRSFAKIFKTIVRFVSIDVVNLFGRHIASHIKPRQSVRRVGFSINFNVNVAVLLQIPGLLTNPNFWPWDRPMKKACRWIIGDDGCKVRMFHAPILPDYETDCKIEGDLNV